MSLPQKLTVQNVDAEFNVKKDGATLGHLLVSKGRIEWRQANKQKPLQLTWSQFDVLMEEHAKVKK